MTASLHQLTCLTSARFRARAPGPVSGQLCHAPGGRTGLNGAGFLLPFGRRPSLLGHPVPPRGSAPLTIGLPRYPARTRAGFPCSARVRRGWGRVPSLPRGLRCLHGQLISLTAACRLPTVLAATLFAHDLAVFRVDDSAGLGGDRCLLPLVAGRAGGRRSRASPPGGAGRARIAGVCWRVARTGRPAGARCCRRSVPRRPGRCWRGRWHAGPRAAWRCRGCPGSR